MMMIMNDNGDSDDDDDVDNDDDGGGGGDDDDDTVTDDSDDTDDDVDEAISARAPLWQPRRLGTCRNGGQCQVPCWRSTGEDAHGTERGKI